MSGKAKRKAERQAAAKKPAPRVASPDDRPPAPWGSAPLAELVILGGMEVAIREHFAGYRSHTTLLAGAVFVFTVGGLFYLADQILAVSLGVGTVAFAIAFFLARRAFQRASGGLGFRVGGMRG